MPNKFWKALQTTMRKWQNDSRHCTSGQKKEAGEAPWPLVLYGSLADTFAVTKFVAFLWHA